MELRQLEAFAAVMSTGSVTAAGRLLGRSQPAISRLLQELEAEIGYPLFARSGPRVTPTEQGFLLYDDVERALTSLQQIRGRADAQATAIYASAYDRDARSRELYTFLRSMEALEKSLDGETSVILSTESELFRFMKRMQ